MKDDRIHVGIIIGGRSVECEISLISGLQAYYAMDKSKYHPTIFYLDKNNHLFVGETLNDINTYKLENIKNLKEVFLHHENNQVYYHYVKRPKKKFPIDVFIPVVHGFGVEDGTVVGMLDLMGAIYSASDVIPSAIVQDKVATKALLDKFMLPNIAYQVLYENHPLESDLSFPVIVKPSYLGSSIGINVAKNEQELADALKEAFAYTDEVLVEKALTDFKEFNCAAICDHHQVITSCVEEVMHTKDILSFIDKYETDLNKLSNATNRIIPALIDKELETKIKELTSKIYTLFHLKGIVRIDFLFDNLENKLYINEINNIPGSLAFYLLEPLGISFTELLNMLIHNAMITHHQKSQKITTFQSNILTKKSSKLMKK